jgi:toxin ParE1/3/4
MAVRLVWSKLARAEAKQIYLDIGRDQPRSAERYFQQFRHKTSMLVDYPRLGPRHPEIFPTARMLVEAPYVILYETFPDDDDADVHTVEIVRIVDSRRDLTTLF